MDQRGGIGGTPLGDEGWEPMEQYTVGRDERGYVSCIIEGFLVS
jgi:hypothetical protein